MCVQSTLSLSLQRALYISRRVLVVVGTATLYFSSIRICQFGLIGFVE